MIYEKTEWNLVCWLSFCKEFIGCVPEDFLLSWVGCMNGGKKARKTRVEWMKPRKGFYKLNVDGAT